MEGESTELCNSVASKYGGESHAKRGSNTFSFERGIVMKN